MSTHVAVWVGEGWVALRVGQCMVSPSQVTRPSVFTPKGTPPGHLGKPVHTRIRPLR